MGPQLLRSTWKHDRLGLGEWGIRMGQVPEVKARKWGRLKEARESPERPETGGALMLSAGCPCDCTADSLNGAPMEC